MRFLKWLRQAEELDFQIRHPIVGFFTDMKYTESRINDGLPMLIVFFVGGAVVFTSWFLLFLAVATVALMRSNYRRYKQRLFYAIDERDRPPGSEPRHPDAPSW